MKTNSIDSIIELHLAKYPAMEMVDMLKLLYQSEFGGGHLIENPQLSHEQVLAELENIPSSAGSACEDLGVDLCRIHLAPLLSLFPDKALSARIINAIFTESAALFKGSLEGYYKRLNILLNLIEQNQLADFCDPKSKNWASDYSSALKYVNNHKAAGCPMLSHSESYKQKYQPAYRVALNEFARYLDLFKQIESTAKEKPHIVIAIDGKCGSGKSTLAKIISTAYNCPIIRVDDFFLPGDLRSDERLSAPGGNVHYERFSEEVITPLTQGKTSFSHRVFDCHAMDYKPNPKEITFSNILVIEGSYSMRPEFRQAYDISIFLDAGQANQKARIIARGGELVYEMFEQKWIPMENRYFEHFNISENCSIVYKSD